MHFSKGVGNAILGGCWPLVGFWPINCTACIYFVHSIWTISRPYIVVNDITDCAAGSGGAASRSQSFLNEKKEAKWKNVMRWLGEHCSVLDNQMIGKYKVINQVTSYKQINLLN